MDSEETGRVSFFQQKTDSTKQLAIQNILFSLVFFSGSVLLKMEKCAANRRARINAKKKRVYFVSFCPPAPLSPQVRTKWQSKHHQVDHAQPTFFHWWRQLVRNFSNLASRKPTVALVRNRPSHRNDIMAFHMAMAGNRQRRYTYNQSVSAQAEQPGSGPSSPEPFLKGQKRLFSFNAGRRAFFLAVFAMGIFLPSPSFGRPKLALGPVSVENTGKGSEKCMA